MSSFSIYLALNTELKARIDMLLILSFKITYVIRFICLPWWRQQYPYNLGNFFYIWEGRGTYWPDLGSANLRLMMVADDTQPK